MTRTVLVVLTQSFPFGDQEATFLPAEMEVLAERFERVLVVPSQLYEVCHPIPEGVEVDASAGVRAPILRASRLLRAVAKGAASHELYRELAARPLAFRNWRALSRLMLYLDRTERLLRWLRAFLSQRPAGEVVILYSYWLGPLTLAAARAGLGRPDVHVVTRAHGGDLYEDRDICYLPLRAETLAAAQQIFTVSEHGRRYLEERYPAARERCEVARLGVADPGFQSAPSLDGRLRLVSCSGLVEVKRVHLIVEGLRELARGRPDTGVEWDHFGGGPLRASVEALARQRLTDQVTWRLHGQVPHERIMKHYRERPVDAFLNVSEAEGVAVSVMEALACGIPPVATAVGGTPEIVSQANGALLDPAATPGEIAAGLLKVAGDEATRAACLRVWRERCDAAQNYSRFADRLIEICAPADVPR